MFGAEYNGVFGLLIEPDGHGSERLWIGSAKDGLAMLDDGAWRYFNTANGALPSNAVEGIWRLPGADGKAYRLLSLRGSGLFRIDDALQVKPVPTPWPIKPGEAAADAIARTVDGRPEWWIATVDDGIYRWRDGHWQAFLAAGATQPWRVLDFAQQMDGHGRAWLWAATAQGLARFDGKSWQLLRDLPGVGNDGYLSVTVFGAKRPQELWAGSNHHGLVRLDIANPLAPRVLENDNFPPLPDPTVYSALHDSRGRVYICTNNGVQQLAPLPGGGYRSRVFHRRDGLVHDECNFGAQRVDRWNRYWVGTLGGLGMYDPSAEPRAIRPVRAPVYFTAVTTGSDTRMFPRAAPLDLPPGESPVQVDYTLLSGQREGESRYRSRLLGFEAAPTAWTPEHRRTFTNLPPGHYTLRVEARDFSGTASTPRSLTFTIEPYWWQRRLAQAIMAALLILAALGAVAYYNRRLHLRQRRLRAIVVERTQELRVANERLTKLSYVDPLTGVANRRRLMEAMDAALARARDKRLPLALIIADIDHFKDYNDRHGHLAGDTALRAVAAAMHECTRGQDLIARYGGEEFVCVMTDAGLDLATRVAERMRLRVAALSPRALGNNEQTLTLSAGVASRVPGAGDTVDGLLAAVDAALYEAKNGGRNRVVQVTDAGFVTVDGKDDDGP